MASNIIRMVPVERQEERTAFAGTVDAYVVKFVSDGTAGTAKIIWKIWSAGAPGSNFNDATLDSEYTDTTAHKLYIKTAASTWTVVGAQS